MELAAPQEDLFQFCHSAVALLRDYDYIHETELLESLRVYLTHNRSIGESAAALYIHRNTMNYRIARINELTQLDLGDPDVFATCCFPFTLWTTGCCSAGTSRRAWFVLSCARTGPSRTHDPRPATSTTGGSFPWQAPAFSS